MTRTNPGRPIRRHPRTTLPLLAPLLLLGLLTVAGCASTGSGAAEGSRDEITREQLMEMPEASAYDVVRRLNSRWLRPRGVGTSTNLDPTDIAVYVGDQREPSGLDALRSYRASELESIEFFDARRATTRWGTGHSAGAIVLTRL